MLRFSRGAGAMGRAVVEVGSDGSPTGLVSEIDSFLPVVDPPEIDDEQVLVDGLQIVVYPLRRDCSGRRHLGFTRRYESLLAMWLADEGRIPQRLQSVHLCARHFAVRRRRPRSEKGTLGINSRRAEHCTRC